MKQFVHLIDVFKNEVAMDVFLQAKAAFQWVVTSPCKEAEEIRLQISKQKTQFRKVSNDGYRLFWTSLDGTEGESNLCEEDIISMLYCNQTFHSRLGKPFCIG